MTDSIYVQHINGYDKPENYEPKARLLKKAGFIRLRSELALDKTDVSLVKDGRLVVDGKRQTMADLEPKFWEIWYLPSAIFADCPIKGKTYGQIMDWLKAIGPGQIESKGQSWGLAID